MLKIVSILMVLSTLNISYAQDLFGERIWKVSSRKKSVFLPRGIFYHKGSSTSARVKAIRHSYNKRTGIERMVFDFDTNVIPGVYGFGASDARKLYLDFFNTELLAGVSSFGKVGLSNGINFYPIDQNTLSVEVSFKQQVNFDIFYLSNPARLVVDIKK